MHWLERIAADALEVMAREAGTLPAELATTSAWVLDHERALIDFARRELAGATTHSLDWRAGDAGACGPGDDGRDRHSRRSMTLPGFRMFCGSRLRFN